jgi:hypothetical protein
MVSGSPFFLAPRVCRSLEIVKRREVRDRYRDPADVRNDKG